MLITLPPTVAVGDYIDPTTWGNVVRTALSRLPRGRMSLVDAQTTTSALAAGIGTSETACNLASTAINTEAGRQYRITFVCEIRALSSMTSYFTARVRRGTTTGGALIFGPTGIPKQTGTAPRKTTTITVYDAPGAVSNQRWCLTGQCDAAAVDIYAPYSVLVEDIGTTT